jgi:hypothetical protein
MWRRRPIARQSIKTKTQICYDPTKIFTSV